MALTSVLAVQNSSVSSGQPTLFTLTLTNTGGSALTLATVSPVVSPVASSVGQGVPFISPQTVTNIPATTGTLSISWSDAFYAGQQPSTLPQQSPVSVACNATTTDGSACTSNSVTVQVTPAVTPTIAMPTAGQLRFDANYNSALLAAV